MMKAQLRTLCVLLCVAVGHGHSLWTLIRTDQKRSAGAAAEARSQSSVSGLALLGLSPVLRPGPSGPSGARARRSPLDPPCALRSVLVQVRDLGLGYDSDETVLFKFCRGSCPQLRSNHDLALSSLLQSGLLPEGGALPRHYAPCCRPTHHEDMAFLDNKHRWHKVERLSAAGCHCVG
ncbi:hypothetical protein WMY93_007010 [Mugilogobius chulae]|uniref:TGF-beta family profile domain-containing protein n=1 Tax=Mugilogobius chulae TaxID=88201 RepID=A0AAW0PLF3_9GOBI